MAYTDYNRFDSRLPIVYISGASRGIGMAIAHAFASAGYQLLLTCNHSMEQLSSLAADLEQLYHITCIPIQADMGNYEQVRDSMLSLPRLDVLINNAGISHVGLLSDLEPQQWRHIIDTNLSSCFYTCKHAVPLMLQAHRGRIINISSVWGNVGASMEVAYSASKGGMNSFTKALAKELAPSNIQVNAVACGVIDTAMNACFSKEDMALLKQEIPADRLGTPAEVAHLVLQLAQAPDYLTGQIITMDGGWC